MTIYLSNKDLAEEIARCQETMIVSDKLARMLMLLVRRIGSKGQFRGYSFLQDMEAEALLQLVRRNMQTSRNDTRPNILKYDAGYAARRGVKPNPFSYATQIVTNVFRRQIKLEQSGATIRDDILEMAHMRPSYKRQIYNEENRSAEPIVRPPKGKVGRKRKEVAGVAGTGQVD